MSENPDDLFSADAVDEFYETFTGLQQEWAQKEQATNHDIYDQRLAVKPGFHRVPHSMYFYYVRINASGQLVVDHYFYVDGDVNDPDSWQKIPYDKDGLYELIKKLALNARPSGGRDDPPVQPQGNFVGVEWRHRSYVVVFFDEANWTFRKKPATGGRGPKEESAVTFIVREGKKRGTPNHSFFDAMDFDISMPIKRPRRNGPTEDLRSAILLVNHMKRDGSGNDIQKDKKQKYTFKMILDVKFATGTDPRMVVIFDPDGTNLGPPVAPP